MKYTSIVVTDSAVWTAAGHRRVLNAALLRMDLLLAWLEQVAPSPELVVLLDATAMAALGIPTSVGAGWTGLRPVYGAGWAHTDMGPWMTYWRPAGGQVIHVGHLPMIDVPGRCPILAIPEPWPLPSDPGWQAVCRRLDRWFTLTGAVYHGTPGVAGTAALRVAWAPTGGRRDTAPMWRADMAEGGLPPDKVLRAGLERDYTTSWVNPQPEAVGRIQLDTNMAYLAAAAAVPTARGPLERRPHHGAAGTPGAQRDAKRAGYWRVQLSPWNEPRVPDPAGYPRADHRPGTPRWVTGPTLDLLDELTDRGLYGGYQILDEWSAPAYRVLRPWAERIRDAIDAALAQGSPVLVASLKAAYRETIGMMGRPGGRVYRPDWQSATIARARCVMWRKVYAAGQRHDLWPLTFNVDAVTYPGTEPPPEWVIHPTKLGAWKIKESA